MFLLAISICNLFVTSLLRPLSLTAAFDSIAYLSKYALSCSLVSVSNDGTSGWNVAQCRTKSVGCPHRTWAPSELWPWSLCLPTGAVSHAKSMFDNFGRTGKERRKFDVGSVSVRQGLGPERAMVGVASFPGVCAGQSDSLVIELEAILTNWRNWTTRILIISVYYDESRLFWVERDGCIFLYFHGTTSVISKINWFQNIFCKLKSLNCKNQIDQISLISG